MAILKKNQDVILIAFVIVVIYFAFFNDNGKLFGKAGNGNGNGNGDLTNAEDGYWGPPSGWSPNQKEWIMDFGSAIGQWG
jgi:hypothetical protein